MSHLRPQQNVQVVRLKILGEGSPHRHGTARTSRLPRPCHIGGPSLVSVTEPDHLRQLRGVTSYVSLTYFLGSRVEEGKGYLSSQLSTQGVRLKKPRRVSLSQKEQLGPRGYLDRVRSVHPMLPLSSNPTIYRIEREDPVLSLVPVLVLKAGERPLFFSTTSGGLRLVQ